MRSEYDEQAMKFLRSSSTTMRIKKAEIQTAPNWAENGYGGYKYQVTLSRDRGAYTFDFWDSIANRQEGKSPTEYAVLSCLTTWEGSLEDFVSEFGYEGGNITKIIGIYNAVIDQTLQLEQIFTASQLRELEEIR